MRQGTGVWVVVLLVGASLGCEGAHTPPDAPDGSIHPADIRGSDAVGDKDRHDGADGVVDDMYRHDVADEVVGDVRGDADAEECRPYSCLWQECGFDLRCGIKFCGECPPGERCENGICTYSGPVLVGEYVPIPAGSFFQQDTEFEWKPECVEREPGEVVITRPFLMKATEVTQLEWKSVFGNAPSLFRSCGPECPVEQVNWWGAVTYANALSHAEGLEECYTLDGCSGTPGERLYACEEVTFVGLDCPGYRLPTEAEWEYAYRAGTTTDFYNGDLREGDLDLLDCWDDEDYRKSRREDCCLSWDLNLDLIGWYCGNTGRSGPRPVGRLMPNDWGLYDMSGNVSEWVWDWWDGCSYSFPPGTDPLGPSSGERRVVRGGDWSLYAEYCTAYGSGAGQPGLRSAAQGFRLVRTVGSAAEL